MEGRVGGKEGLDLLLVLLRFQGTGGIDQAAPGFQAGQGIFENAALGNGQCVEVLGLEPPAGIDAPAQHPGVRAGDIEENSVEAGPPFAGRCGGPIENGHDGDGNVQPLKIFGETGKAAWIGIGAQQFSFVLHGRGEERGLPTRGGAGVEDSLAGSGGEKFYGVPGRGILHVDETLFDPVSRDGAVENERAVDGCCGEREIIFVGDPGQGRTAGRGAEGV